MKEKPSYYAIIPAEVRYSKKLTPNAKLLYAEITALCNMNGKCTASTEYFCRLYEVSRGAVQNWLKMLDDNGYIDRTVIYRQGSKEIMHRYINLKDKGSINISTDNTNINITNTNLTDSNKKTFFKKPTVEEVHQYCNERKNKVCADAFIDFYESKDWMVGSNKMKNWKACVRTWEKRENRNNNTLPHRHQKGQDYGDGTF